MSFRYCGYCTAGGRVPSAGGSEYSQHGEVRQVLQRARVQARQRVRAQLQAREAAAGMQSAGLHHLHTVVRQ